MKRVIVATTNEGKIKEIKDLLSGCSFEVLSSYEAGIFDKIDENGRTFAENALIKARYIHKLTGDIVIADDSGLEIDFLNGEPGIYSSRFMGDLPYSVRNERIVDLLENAKDEERTARFRCTAALVTSSAEKVYEGILEGKIALKPQGNNGFGYDPIFYVPEYCKTLAQLDNLTKNKISHRGKAFRLHAEDLKKLESV